MKLKSPCLLHIFSAKVLSTIVCFGLGDYLPLHIVQLALVVNYILLVTIFKLPLFIVTQTQASLEVTHVTLQGKWPYRRKVTPGMSSSSTLFTCCQHDEFCPSDTEVSLTYINYQPLATSCQSVWHHCCYNQQSSVSNWPLDN